MSNQTIEMRKTFANNGRSLSDSPHSAPVRDNSKISEADDIVSENRSQTSDRSMDPFGAIRGVLWALSLEAVFAAIIFALVLCVLWANRP